MKGNREYSRLLRENGADASALPHGPAELFQPLAQGLPVRGVSLALGGLLLVQRPRQAVDSQAGGSAAEQVSLLADGVGDVLMLGDDFNQEFGRAQLPEPKA